MRLLSRAKRVTNRVTNSHRSCETCDSDFILTGHDKNNYLQSKIKQVRPPRRTSIHK